MSRRTMSRKYISSSSLMVLLGMKVLFVMIMMILSSSSASNSFSGLRNDERTLQQTLQQQQQERRQQQRAQNIFNCAVQLFWNPGGCPSPCDVGMYELNGCLHNEECVSGCLGCMPYCKVQCGEDQCYDPISGECTEPLACLFNTSTQGCVVNFCGNCEVVCP